MIPDPQPAKSASEGVTGPVDTPEQLAGTLMLMDVICSRDVVRVSNMIRKTADNEVRSAVEAAVGERDKEIERLKDSHAEAWDQNKMLRDELTASRARVEELKKVLKRVLSSIPRDRNERTGMRGSFHDEQPDSPAGFLECDCDELLEEIINRVESALAATRRENG